MIEIECKKFIVNKLINKKKDVEIFFDNYKLNFKYIKIFFRILNKIILENEKIKNIDDFKNLDIQNKIIIEIKNKWNELK